MEDYLKAQKQIDQYRLVCSLAVDVLQGKYKDGAYQSILRISEPDNFGRPDLAPYATSLLDSIVALRQFPQYDELVLFINAKLNEEKEV